MQTSSRSLFSKILFAFMVPFFVSGCTGAMYAAQFIPTAMVAYSFLPAGTELEYSQPDGGVIDPGIFKSIQSVVTANEYAHEYLSSNKDSLFPVVKKTAKQPLSTYSAADSARSNGVSAFVLVDVTGMSSEMGLLNAKIVHGSASVTVVTRNGKPVYEQTAVLKQKLSSATTLSPRKVSEILAQALVEDMKKGRSTTVAGPREEKSWFSKILSF